MSEKDQGKTDFGSHPDHSEGQGGYPQPHGYHPVGHTEGQHSEKSPPPPYDQLAGQQYGYPSHPQGYPSQPQGYPSQTQEYPSQPQGYPQPPPPQQGYSKQLGYQPVPQGYGQPTYPTQYPAYGQPGHNVVLTQPVPGQMTIVTAQPRPTNWLGPAIFACLCCFCPTGICAIAAAMNANSAADHGDMELAEEKARTARCLTIFSVVMGVVCITISIVLRVVAFSSSGYY